MLKWQRHCTTEYALWTSEMYMIWQCADGVWTAQYVDDEICVSAIEADCFEACEAHARGDLS